MPVDAPGSRRCDCIRVDEVGQPHFCGWMYVRRYCGGGKAEAEDSCSRAWGDDVGWDGACVKGLGD
jgi:hypothetical protein